MTISTTQDEEKFLSINCFIYSVNFSPSKSTLSVISFLNSFIIFNFISIGI
ncbi:unnamed protein product [Schistosoma margrebowiei]|uniref:Uncharacterized protein n=1 Tax=Schistosoma margrebowiei TaxID=48269 RepID=A0A3P8EWN7_9TREM|nr:unnamed protein product [Schistosoma margrebowiei]